jgi:hypothetical protein
VRNGCRVIELDAFGTVGVPLQPPPVIGLNLYAGIRIEGTLGRTYRIEYVTAAESADWITLTNLVLFSTPFTIVDPAPASEARRYYRAVEVPLP